MPSHSGFGDVLHWPNLTNYSWSYRQPIEMPSLDKAVFKTSFQLRRVQFQVQVPVITRTGIEHGIAKH